MPQFTPKREEQILQQMINVVVARTDLSDISDASVFKHFLKAVARELDEAYFQITLVQDDFNIDTARGDNLDRRAAEIAPGTITRNQATKATGTVVFSRSGTTGAINIPIGTVVKTSDGQSFETTALGTISDGNSESAAVAAIAQVAGAAGNVAPATVVKFDSKPAGVDAVTNQVTFTNGTDKESDIAFRDRIRDFIAALPKCTVRALEVAATEVQLSNGQRVASANAIEDLVNIGDVYLYIDDGFGTAEASTAVVGENITAGFGGAASGGDSAVGGEEYAQTDNYPVKGDVAYSVTSDGRGLLVEGTDYVLNTPDGQLYFTPALVASEIITMDYTHYTGLVREAQKVIDGDSADRTNYPGFRAAGVRVFVLSPTVAVQAIEADITVSEGFDFDDVSADVEAAILDYINNLNISDDVIRARIIEVIMSVAGVQNVGLVSPASDVIILDDQIARTDTVNIEIN